MIKKRRKKNQCLEVVDIAVLLIFENCRPSQTLRSRAELGSGHVGQYYVSGLVYICRVHTKDVPGTAKNYPTYPLFE